MWKQKYSPTQLLSKTKRQIKDANFTLERIVKARKNAEKLGAETEIQVLKDETVYTKVPLTG